MTAVGRAGLLLGACTISMLGCGARVDLRTERVSSEALAGNAVGDPALRDVLVLLPASYRSEPGRRYPVLYLLHGAGARAHDWLDGYPGLDLRRALERAGGEFLVVMPDASSRLPAIFYTASPAAGDWDRFVGTDLVAHVDRRYRTVRDPRARALAGHSAGGFGALSVGLRRPEAFGLVYAMSPCGVALAGFAAPEDPGWGHLARLRRWTDGLEGRFTDRLRLSLAIAVDGDPGDPRLFRTVPVQGEPAALWSRRLPIGIVEEGAARRRPFPELRLEAGASDDLVLPGVHSLCRRLDELRVPYSLDTFPGGHTDRMRERVAEHLLPFVGRWLEEGRTAR